MTKSLGHTPSYARLAITVTCLLALTVSGTAVAQTGVAEKFELGDSQNPEVPGTGDIWSVSGLAGPDWHELFLADGTLRDIVDAAGNPQPNGIPDFIDTHQGRAAVFIGDDVSAGTVVDLTGRHMGDRVNNNTTIAPKNDLGNAYVYLEGTGSDFSVFLGLERIETAGPTLIEFELNQELFRLGHGWPDTVGWEVVGQRADKDVRLSINLGPNGELLSVDLHSWEDPAGTGEFSWLLKDALGQEGCNTDDPGASPPIGAGSFCAFRNAATIAGGEWPSFDATGTTKTEIGADCFFEIGLNVGGLVGITDPSFGYRTVRLRTPDDVAFGHFAEGN